MFWITRVGAIPGKYAADGVWGNATLEMQRDGYFVETWHFKNESNGRPEGDGSAKGRWRDAGRDWLTRDIVLESFRPLAEYDRNRGVGAWKAIVMGYGGIISIEVDSGADIAFSK
jgi:hypothetical protein